MFQPVAFNAGGLSVTPGQQLVLFATSSRDNPGHSGAGMWGSTGDTLPAGTFVFLNNGTGTTQWTSTTWSTFPTEDLAIQVAFDSPAPVANAQGAPTLSEWAFILLAFGLAGIGARSLPRSGANV